MLLGHTGNEGEIRIRIWFSEVRSFVFLQGRIRIRVTSTRIRNPAWNRSKSGLFIAPVEGEIMTIVLVFDEDRLQLLRQEGKLYSSSLVLIVSILGFNL